MWEVTPFSYSKTEPFCLFKNRRLTPRSGDMQ